MNFRDLILDEEAAIDADLVVLATGQVPNAGVNIELPEDDAAPRQAKQVSILNLNYRQGPDMPQFKYGFADSHFICFPYETRRTGIYAAGPVRRPMDMLQATEDATGAALKAIQAVENASLGRAAHPRSGDLSFPIVRLEGCTQCKRCTVECPFGAIDEDERRFPVFNEQPLPPLRHLHGRLSGARDLVRELFGGYRRQPDQGGGHPGRVFREAAHPGAGLRERRLSGARHGRPVAHVYSAFVRVIPVRCLGSVNTIWITDALNSGYDGVMMMGCKKGDDYQCHFVKGSELATLPHEQDRRHAKAAGAGARTCRQLRSGDHRQRARAQLINEYVGKIKEIGMSPMKGFA